MSSVKKNLKGLWHSILLLLLLPPRIYHMSLPFFSVFVSTRKKGGKKKSSDLADSFYTNYQLNKNHNKGCHNVCGSGCYLKNVFSPTWNPPFLMYYRILSTLFHELIWKGEREIFFFFILTLWSRWYRTNRSLASDVVVVATPQKRVNVFLSLLLLVANTN